MHTEKNPFGKDRKPYDFSKNTTWTIVFFTRTMFLGMFKGSLVNSAFIQKLKNDFSSKNKLTKYR